MTLCPCCRRPLSLSHLVKESILGAEQIGVKKIRRRVRLSIPFATDKEIANVLSNLVRGKHVNHISYGVYAPVETEEQP